MISSAASTMALKMGMTASMATLWMASKGALQGRLSVQEMASTNRATGGRSSLKAKAEANGLEAEVGTAFPTADA